MDIKTIKKSTSLTGITMSLLLAMAFFTGMYLYWNQNVTDAGYTLDSKYNESYGNITLAQSDLSDNVDDIKNNLDNIGEADSTFQVAWNGLKGLGNTLLLPISFINTALATYTGLDYALDFVPKWVRTITLIGLIGLLVFLVLSIIKGDPRL